MIAIPANKTYSGRLSFNPDTGFHEGEDGKPVVSEDGGRTWHRASPDDPSHFDRYHQRYVGVDGTANEPASLALQALGAEAPPEVRQQLQAQISAHHFEAQPNDPHYGGLQHDPDAVAEKITSHTDAYKDAPVDHPAAVTQ